MLVMLALLNGLSLAAAFVILVRTIGRRYTVPLHAGMLVVAALCYVAFALGSGSRTGLLVELAGTAAFGTVAAAGLVRRSPHLLALGWALHPVWDIALHTAGAGAAYTPEGWVVACIGFDGLLAVLLAAGRAGLAPTRERRTSGAAAAAGGPAELAHPSVS